jgi:hypothetical protein
MDGWHGVDLDGTLAEYDGWQGATHIGRPIPKMVERVKRWLAAGEQVKIFTARVCSNNPGRFEASQAIDVWCLEVFGQTLPQTAEKDYYMIDCWDDRCVQVVPNLGIAVQDLLAKRLGKKGA